MGLFAACKDALKNMRKFCRNGYVPKWTPKMDGLILKMTSLLWVPWPISVAIGMAPRPMSEDRLADLVTDEAPRERGDSVGSEISTVFCCKMSKIGNDLWLGFPFRCLTLGFPKWCLRLGIISGKRWFRHVLTKYSQMKWLRLVISKLRRLVWTEWLFSLYERDLNKWPTTGG